MEKTPHASDTQEFLKLKILHDLIKANEYLKERLAPVQAPTLKLVSDAASKAEDFYRKNQSDIDAILSYPGNPTGYVDDVVRAVYKSAPAAAIAVSPSTLEKLMSKIVENYKLIRSGGANIGYNPKTADTLALAQAYVAARYPKLFSRVGTVKIDPDLMGTSSYMMYRSALGEGPPGVVGDIHVNPMIASVNLGRDKGGSAFLTKLLSHELKHLAQDLRNAPSISYFDPPPPTDTLLAQYAYALSPAEIEARRFERIAEIKERMFRRMRRYMRNPDLMLIPMPLPEYYKRNTRTLRDIAESRTSNVERKSLELMRRLRDEIARHGDYRLNIPYGERIDPEQWALFAIEASGGDLPEERINVILQSLARELINRSRPR